MRNLIMLVSITAACLIGGCKSDDNGSMQSKTSSTAKPMSADACPHCAGVQTATAAGKCPVCGMKLGSTR
jgi:uncharacterized paraquat-inducible protein A